MTPQAVEVLDFAAEVERIQAERYAAFDALRTAFGRGLTIDDIDAHDVARIRIARRCEVLRRAFYPQWGQLAVIAGAVLVISRSGRASRIVWRKSVSERCEVSNDHATSASVASQ